jgi:hypothetical protein
MTDKNRKKLKISCFESAGCSFLRAKGLILPQPRRPSWWPRYKKEQFFSS